VVASRNGGRQPADDIRSRLEGLERMVTRCKIRRLWCGHCRQSENCPQICRRVRRRRDAAHSGTSDFVRVDWSPDGRYLSYDAHNLNEGHLAQWILPLFGDRKPFRCAPVVGGSQYDGNFSPDGHWLAYFSDETGQPEVYVVPFPGPGGKYQISQNGGWLVRWDKKGDLFFLTTGNQLTKAELHLSTQSLQVKSLRPLFQINLADTPAPLFDVTADGQRFLAVTPARAESSSISLLLNWPQCCTSKLFG
jgi:hypothetical protein